MRAVGVLALATVALLVIGCEEQKRSDIPQVDLEELRAETPTQQTVEAEVEVETPAVETSEEPEPAPEPEQPPARVYTMQAGDTLYTLARRFYGDGKLWTKIYEANKDKVRDVYDIPVGTELSIPPK